MQVCDADNADARVSGWRLSFDLLSHVRDDASPLGDFATSQSDRSFDRLHSNWQRWKSICVQRRDWDTIVEWSTGWKHNRAYDLVVNYVRRQD